MCERVANRGRGVSWEASGGGMHRFLTGAADCMCIHHIISNLRTMENCPSKGVIFPKVLSTGSPSPS